MKIVLILFLTTFTSILTDDIDQSFISGNNLFTAAVYKEFSKKSNENFLVSPFSAETLMALVHSGAKGQTAEEIRTSLQLPNDQSKIESTFKNLLPKLKTEDDKPFAFETANKLYVQENFTIKNEFKSVASDIFGAGLDNIDFSKSKEAAKSMNEWVEKRTHNKIHDLIKPDQIGSDTAAVIINALYFKGNWSSPFRNSSTEKKDFHQLDKKVVQVDTMHLFDDELTFNYAENEDLGAVFLELPFQGEDVSMGFILPKEKDGISKLEKQIDKVFQPQSYTREYVKVSIPKFKIESEIDFKEVLQNLGVKTAFTPGGADFGGISENLYISDVIQKTFIDVNEDGVEAAAATFASFALFSAHFIPEEPKQFHVDHPFIYYIKVKGLIVFAGRVTTPKY